MRRSCRGNAIIEAAIFFPIFLLLIVPMIQFGKLTYTYYALRNVVYTAARYLAVQKGTNFCNSTSDPNIVAAENFAVTGTIDASGAPLIENLTPSMLSVTTECVVNGAVGPCDTSECGISASLQQEPDYVAVTIAGGYPFTPRIPYVTLQTLSLAPSALVAFGGAQ
jgi:Flp pilus assembly protein TadG